MTHDHDHDHSHHSHEAEADSGMPFSEKLEKILEHWIRHNDDHAATYRDWAHQASHHDLNAVAGILEEAAQITDTISKRLQDAAGLMRK
jgi:transcription termination factor NusB